MIEIPVFTLDAFTNLPFKGNPAAVCPLVQELNDDLYQKIAAEINLSETAFITRLNPSDSFSSENVNPVLVFETKSGDLAVTKQGEGYIMDFPLNPPTQEVHLKVDPVALQSSERSGRVKGLILTMKDCQPGYDFYSRYFAPWNGIPEDPVTGSAHTVLGSYWSEKLGKKKMLAYQCSGRGGELELEVRDDGRINIAGQTVTVLQGTIRL
ncbi:hypothetical protein F2P81_004652 [Scophthalmus maximus]|uniref:Phenazine biosynthesis-like domain-containing protein n=1 Tax=Scophthalmus maximus TaxID=52904 RepID=A0A6A4TDN5_SCOMX|nr:hypothetical protein F2P81_004652 [Scophthalmus maximus]